MQLLLMSKKQITSSEAPGTLGALERFFFGVRTLMAFEMFQSCKGSTARPADMRPWLVRLGRWKIRVVRLRPGQRSGVRTAWGEFTLSAEKRPSWSFHLRNNRAVQHTKMVRTYRLHLYCPAASVLLVPHLHCSPRPSLRSLVGCQCLTTSPCLRS